MDQVLHIRKLNEFKTLKKEAEDVYNNVKVWIVNLRN